MPSWPSKLVSASSITPTTNSTILSSQEAPNSSQPSDFSFESVPTLAPQSSSRSTQLPESPGRNSSKHGRSLSLPFPSIFGAGRRTRKDGDGNENGRRGSQPRRSPHEAFPQDPKLNSPTSRRLPDKDMITGRCMTCDSIVRWPKALSTFRCTICLTINDLVILQPESLSFNQQMGGKGTSRVQEPVIGKRFLSIILSSS